MTVVHRSESSVKLISIRSVTLLLNPAPVTSTYVPPKLPTVGSTLVSIGGTTIESLAFSVGAIVPFESMYTTDATVLVAIEVTMNFSLLSPSLVVCS